MSRLWISERLMLCHSILRCSALLSVLALSGCLLDDVTVDENFNTAPGNGGSTARSQVGSAANSGGATAGSAGAGMMAAAGTGSMAPAVVAAGGSSGAGSEVNSNANSNTGIAPAANGGASGAGTAGASSTASATASTGGSSGGSTTTPVQTVPLNAAYHPEREQACGDYCTLYTSVCAGHPANDYKDLFDCANFCLDSDWPVGDLASVVPGTVTCRYFHAGLAKDQGLTPHCYHAARVPTMGGCQVVTTP
jgi:hypothetical protein